MVAKEPMSPPQARTRESLQYQLPIQGVEEAIWIVSSTTALTSLTSHSKLHCLSDLSIKYACRRTWEIHLASTWSFLIVAIRWTTKAWARSTKALRNLGYGAALMNSIASTWVYSQFVRNRWGPSPLKETLAHLKLSSYNAHSHVSLLLGLPSLTTTARLCAWDLVVGLATARAEGVISWHLIVGARNMHDIGPKKTAIPVFNSIGPGCEASRQHGD